MLHNLEYHDGPALEKAEKVLVPTEFARGVYRQRLGIDCHRLPYVVDQRRVDLGGSWQPRFVTFVNPSTEKGAAVFVRIAEQLHRRRPDIPLLVVEGRGTLETLQSLATSAKLPMHVHVMSNQGDPRTFYRRSKIVLMPSLWLESSPLVAAEAMTNGIPVLGSNRGGLPETLGDDGFVLDIPAKYTEFTSDVPTADEVEPWVETIIRLWDDDRFYAAARERAFARAKYWRPENIAPLYKQFFERFL
jgi:glycosyltransferase involved in cell wall biosynthesis